MIKRLSYEARLQYFTHPFAKRLLTLMSEKKTNLCIAADVTSADDLLRLADNVGPEICLFKTHVDMLNDFSESVIASLMTLANKHHFFIFEDRKFADIGNTVFHQYENGIYKISSWADVVNAHALPGDGIISGLKKAGLSKQRACLLIAEMSGKTTLFTPSYTESVLTMAKAHRDFVIGFIAQQRLMETPDFIYMTPGVSFSKQSDPLGQTYIAPETAILENGSDIIIVGRSVALAANPRQMAREYRQIAWAVYENDL